MSKRRNPKGLDLGNILNWGVRGVAAYGGYRAYQTLRSKDDEIPALTDSQRCTAAGGMWIPDPTFRYVPGQPAPGRCVMPGGGLVRKTL